jgi:hypothetical protein
VRNDRAALVHQKELRGIHRVARDVLKETVTLSELLFFQIFYEIRPRPPGGPPGALGVSHSKSAPYDGFVWARAALDGQKRRFPARAVMQCTGVLARNGRAEVFHGRNMDIGLTVQNITAQVCM